VPNAWRIGIGAAVVVAAVVLFLVLRQAGDDSTSLAGATGSVPTTTEEAPTDTTAPTDTGTTDTGGQTTTDANKASFRIDVPQGGPTEVQRLDVRQGQKVVIVVTLKTHEDVHLHGYDLLLHTGPGLPPAKFQFTADTPGSFELEMEESAKQIAELRVTP
jgi:hypothetical protein